MTKKNVIRRGICPVVAVVLLTLTVLALGFLNYTGILRFPEYDTVAPAMPELQHPAVLVLSKTNGFIHREAIPAGTTMLTELAEKNGWNLYQTDNAATHNSEGLLRFDVVIWNNTSGDILTDEQRQAFKSWLLSGGRWLGIRAAGGDPFYAWDWYRDTLIGAQFIGHTMSPQLHPFTGWLAGGRGRLYGQGGDAPTLRGNQTLVFHHSKQMADFMEPGPGAGVLKTPDDVQVMPIVSPGPGADFSYGRMPQIDLTGISTIEVRAEAVSSIFEGRYPATAFG